MEGTRNLKSVGLHGSIGLPEPQVNERIRGQIRSTIVLYSDEQKNLVIIEATILCKTRIQREEPICTTSLVMYMAVLMK